MKHRGELGFLASVTSGTEYRQLERQLRALGWAECGAGDWAFALRSPRGAYAARISPFDPAAPYVAMLYRRATGTGQVPALAGHRTLAGGADLTVMEFLRPVPQRVAAEFLRSIDRRDPEVAELADAIAEVHALVASEQPWWGPLDSNPANVMRGNDDRLLVTDLFYADGPRLYAAASTDPDRVVRDYPPQKRRHFTELPLTSSGGWDEDERDRLTAGLAAADQRLSGSR